VLSKTRYIQYQHPKKCAKNSMFRLLESTIEITSAQKALEKTIRAAFTHQEPRNIGYPGGKSLSVEFKPIVRSGITQTFKQDISAS
jgi:hypothetical protein